jgi:hypothetical protein
MHCAKCWRSVHVHRLRVIFGAGVPVTQQQLKSKHSCHSGARNNARWNVSFQRCGWEQDTSFYGLQYQVGVHSTSRDIVCQDRFGWNVNWPWRRPRHLQSRNWLYCGRIRTRCCRLWLSSKEHKWTEPRALLRLTPTDCVNPQDLGGKPVQQHIARCHDSSGR